MPLTDEDLTAGIMGEIVQQTKPSSPVSRRYLYSSRGRDCVSIIQDKMIASEELKTTSSSALAYMKDNKPSTPRSTEITDYDIQAVVDNQLPLDEKNRLMERIIRCPDSLNRMEELMKQKRLLREWWKSEWKDE